MLVWVNTMLMLAVQLELAWLPSSSAHDTVVLFPLYGAAVNCTVVPMGMGEWGQG